MGEEKKITSINSFVDEVHELGIERLLTNRTTTDEIKDLDTEKYFQEIRASELSKDGSCEKFGYMAAR